MQPIRNYAIRAITRYNPESRAKATQHAMSEMKTWTFISGGMMVAVAAAVVANFTGASHESHEEKPQLAYMRQRKVQFPWECNDCTLFDSECKKKFRESQQ
mmetsp:Transcript_37750/g.97389  ORF Transcript_37750/g.97389 Transcript_37750/m.97389 type:complete len:101 (-) Transcript_37750:177-479(-)